MSEREELLPCPFCGSKTIRTYTATCTQNQQLYRVGDRLFPIVRCGGCYAEACGKDGDRGIETAIAAWNRRAAADAILSRRPADDDALVEMATQAILRDAPVAPAMTEGEAREVAETALSVYRAHDPLLREAREALEAIENADTFTAAVARARIARRKLEGGGQ